MLLFQGRFHEGLVRGSITLTFRLWPTARVKPGSKYRCHPIGVLEVDAVDRVRVKDISDSDAEHAGFPEQASLLDYLQSRSQVPITKESEVFRIALHFAGEGDFIPLAQETDLSAEDFSAVSQQLQKLDASSKTGPWTRDTLNLIEQHPHVAASRLAKMVQRETKPFKANVVKLKKLGLTQSFEIGYEVSPRGRVFLERSRTETRRRGAASQKA
jgi:hypothetical protein